MERRFFAIVFFLIEVFRFFFFFFCRPFGTASPSETLPTLLIFTDFARVKTFQKITRGPMFMVTHKVGLSVAATPGYYAIKVNVHEGRRREERTMHSLSRELLPCQSNECDA